MGMRMYSEYTYEKLSTETANWSENTFVQAIATWVAFLRSDDRLPLASGEKPSLSQIQIARSNLQMLAARKGERFLLPEADKRF